MHSSSAALFSVKLFGEFDFNVRPADCWVPVPLSGYARYLLSYLCLTENMAVSKDQLVDEIWPSTSVANSRQRTNLALHDLRAAIGSIDRNAALTIRSNRDSIWFESPATLICDFHDFRTAANSTAAVPLESLQELIARTNGDFLYAQRSLPWIALARVNVFRESVKIRVRAAELQLQAGRIQESVVSANLVFKSCPTSEAACAALMRAHAAAGERHLAIEAFDQLRRALKDEFDMRASESMLRLAESIRKSNVGDLEASMPDDHADLLDSIATTALGRQSTVQDARAQKQISDASPAAGTSVQIDSFGAAIMRAVETPAVDCVCLWGLPGIGKSHAIREFSNLAIKSQRYTLIRLQRADDLHLAAVRKEIADARAIVVLCFDINADAQMLTTIYELAKFIAPDAKCIFTSRFYLDKSRGTCIRIAPTSQRSQAPYNTEIAPAVLQLIRFAETQGQKALIDRSYLSKLEELCRYTGGHPGLSALIAQRLEYSPMSLVNEWLHDTAVTLEPNSSGASYDLIGLLQQHFSQAMQNPLATGEQLVLAALCKVNCYVSLFTLADALKIARSDIVSTIESLARLGIVTTVRSSEFDIVFAFVPEIISDILCALDPSLRKTDFIEQVIQSYLAVSPEIRGSANKDLDRRKSEVMRFEFELVEQALRVALANQATTQVLCLSRLLRRHYFEGGQVKSASQFFYQALSLSVGPKDIADFNTVLGGLYERSGFAKLAMTHLKRARKLAVLQNDQVRLATILHSFGVALANAGWPRRAMPFLYRALYYYRSHGIKNREVLAFASVAYICINELEISQALRILSFARPKESAHEKNTANVVWNSVQAYLEYFGGNLTEAQRFLKASIEMTSPTTFVQIVFKQKILSVLLHLWQGETETASSLSLEASKKMLALNYRADAIYVLSLGVVAETMAKNYGAARTILAKLVALREDVDDIQSLGMYSYAACRLEIECGEVRFENYVDADFRKNFARFPQYIRQGFLHLLETLAPQSKLAQELSGGRYVPSETLVPLFRLG